MPLTIAVLKNSYSQGIHMQCSEGSEKRDGERRNRDIDVVVCCEYGVPILASEVEINFGGMVVNTSSGFKQGVSLELSVA